MLTEDDLETAAESGQPVDAEGAEVRAQLIAELLTRERRESGARPRALRLANGVVTGALDLSSLDLLCPLVLVDCEFEQAVNLDDAQAPNVDLSGCRIPSVSARQLRTRGDVRMNGIEADSVDCTDARIGGSLTFMGAKLTGQDGFAFFGNRLEIGGGLSLQDVVAGGEVRMTGARIHGQVLLSGAKIEHTGGSAVTMDGVAIRGGLVAAGAEITGAMRLIEATLDGQVVMDDAVLRHPSGIALSADGLTASGLYAEGLRSEGQVRLTGARIASDLVLDGAELSNPFKHAFSADNLDVGTNVFCRRGFAATGGIRLDGARIGGGLVFEHASITNPDDLALDASGLSVGQHLAFSTDVAIEGDVRLTSARVGHALVVDGVTFSGPGRLLLTGAHAREFVDFEWPQVPARRPWYRRWQRQPAPSPERPYTPRLNGFVYERLAPRTDEVDKRLDWIAHAEQAYVPQAYDQLAATYRSGGREEDARAVMVAKQRAKRGQLRLPGRMWSRFLDVTVGFGYHTGRAVFGLLAVMLAGWGVFAWASWEHLTPLKDASQLPQFEPWLYSMDAVLPVITFGQEAAWSPTGFALYWYTFSVLAGWILGTALIAALTAMLNRS